MKFYTWKDVERYFLLHRASWESAIAAVDVYPTDITVYAKEEKYYRYFPMSCITRHLIRSRRR